MTGIFVEGKLTLDNDHFSDKMWTSTVSVSQGSFGISPFKLFTAKDVWHDLTQILALSHSFTQMMEKLYEVYYIKMMHCIMNVYIYLEPVSTPILHKLFQT